MGEVLFFLTSLIRLVLQVDAVASGEVLGDDHDRLALPEEMVEGLLRFRVLANHRRHLRVIEDDDECPPPQGDLVGVKPPVARAFCHLEQALILGVLLSSAW